MSSSDSTTVGLVDTSACFRFLVGGVKVGGGTDFVVSTGVGRDPSKPYGYAIFEKCKNASVKEERGGMELVQSSGMQRSVPKSSCV